MTTSAPASPQVSNVTGSSLTVTGRPGETPVSPRAAALASKPAAEWTAEDFRGFVIAETLRMNGPQLPVQRADQLMTEFFERFGANAVKIVRQVFEAHGGMWRGAPVTVRRLAPSNDQFFAAPILAEIG
jgi:hypothetical protein